MATGANSTPIKKLHPIMAAKEESNTPLGSKSALKNPELQAHLEAAKRAASQLFTKEEQPTTKKIRRSRWGAEQTRTVLPGLPTILPSNMSEEQRKLYLIHLQVEDISRRLRIDDLGIPINPLDRSPSPEPLYSHDGKRLNTREMRARKKMEDKRHELVQLALTMNPNYHPPIDYRAPTKKFEDKIFIPQDANPQTNFVGLLIGPRGVTLKNMEKETNCKIMIRGKGASKEGKFRGIPQPGEDEELHALVSASSPDDLKKAVDKIKGIIQSGIDNPGNDNDLKKQQMMQLAELNGTFRPIDILRCNNCGASTHRTWECPEGQNITSTVICSKCGSGGHIASDCKVVITSDSQNMSYTEKAKMDSEYQSLMKELGEKVPENKSGGSLFANDSVFGNKGAAIPPPGPLMPCENPHGVTVHGTPWVATAMPLPLTLPAVPILGPDGTWVAPINPFAPVPVVQTAPSPPPQSHNNNKEQQPFPWGGPPPAPVNGVPTPSSAPTPLMAAPPLPPPDKNGPPPPPPMPMEPPPPPPPM